MATVTVTVPSISVVVAAGRAGRAVLPTLRSVAAVADEAVELIVVVAPEDRELVEGIVERGIGRREVRVLAGGSSRASQRNAGVAAGAGDVVALLDAGDLVSSRWLAAAASCVAACSRVVVHPELVVTFGRRSGYWPQPSDDDGRSLLPVSAAWASPVVLARALAVELPFPDVDDRMVDVAWQVRCADADVVNDRARGTAAFVRVWSDRAPWKTFLPELPPASPTYTDLGQARARGALPSAGGIRTSLRRIRPIVQAVGMFRRMRRALPRRPLRIEPWLRSEWLRANASEPLVPFPRRDVASWYERAAEDTVVDARRARAYWSLIASVGMRPDYVFFAPWIRTGGGDLVLTQYVEAVRDLDPTARVLVMTTEPEESTRLTGLPAGAVTFEARELYRRGVSRADLVEHVLPLALSQWRPHTVHAFNSTVAFDVVETHGSLLAAASRLFLSSFVIDRTPDGERTSVFFLRRPGFLDPVRRVLTDSGAFIAQMVTELGYDPERFQVVHQAVPRLVALPDPRSEDIQRFNASRPLRVLWVGRFDVQKRLDILESVVVAARRRGIPLTVDVYGEPVMSEFGPDRRRALAGLGVTLHAPYSSAGGFPSLDGDLYLMTSEWEGIPNTLLEAMAAGIPVMAPLVGGVGEVLDERTGFPVVRFDDIEAYVDALAEVTQRYDVALARARAARALIEDVFSKERFAETIAALDGYLRPST